MRHVPGRSALLAAGAATLALVLGACSSTDSQQPVATHSRSHHRATSSPAATGGTSSAPVSTPPTSPSSSAAAAAGFVFDPRSGGRHSHVCIQVKGTDPVDYIYYPVIVKPRSPVTLDHLAVTYADGVQVAGSYVAPAPAAAGTGFIEGWPAPPILTQSTSVQWSKKVDATGAALAAGTPYNVFLHLRVYPDALPYHTDGVVLTYSDGSGSHEDTWVDHVTYQSTPC